MCGQVRFFCFLRAVRFRFEHVWLLEGKGCLSRVDSVCSKMQWDPENRGTDIGKESMTVWDTVCSVLD